MKKLVFILGLGLMFAACGDNAQESETKAPAVEDTPIETPAPAIDVPAVAPAEETTEQAPAAEEATQPAESTTDEAKAEDTPKDEAEAPKEGEAQ